MNDEKGGEPFDIDREITQLLAYYLDVACACRFPRFRAACELDTGAIGAPGHTTGEQQSLILAFTRAVPLVGRQDAPKLGGFRATCARCGALVQRGTIEYFRDVFFETMQVRPAKGVVDVGEALYSPVPRCSDFLAVRPTSRQEETLLASSYPKIPAADWIAWMRAVKTLA